jgi:hypothetical protein
MREKLSPAQTARAQCADCLGLMRFDRDVIEACKGDTCLTVPCRFYPYRLGKRIPVKVFRAFCKDCMGGNDSFIKDCPSIKCKVYPYRMGKNPSRQGIGNHCAEIGRGFIKTDQELKISGQGL